MNPILFSFHEHTPAEWDEILSMAWIILTPIGLILASVILLVRLVTKNRWRSRMARASFILVLSYAVLVTRLVYRVFTSENEEDAPDPFFAAFYVWAIAYFVYALIREWIGPMAVDTWRVVTGRSDSTRDAERDVLRDAGRDADRDTARDLVRDPGRDGPRDYTRDANVDRENQEKETAL